MDDERKVPCFTTKGKTKKQCKGWVPYKIPPIAEQKLWQFRCSVCGRYNLVSGIGVPRANAPKPFDLDNLPRILQD